MQTPTGTTVIEELRVGDMVLSRSDAGGPDGSIQARRVTAVHVTNPRSILHLKFQTAEKVEEMISSTGNHPFYSVTAAGFVNACELSIGDEVSLISGVATVVGTEEEFAADGQHLTTYNISVEEDHTYFVGNVGIWVHNTGEACQMLAREFYRNIAKGANTKEAFQSLVDAMRKQWKGASSAEWTKHIADVAKELNIDISEATALLQGSDEEVAEMIARLTELRGIRQAEVYDVIQKFGLKRMADDPYFLKVWDDVLAELAKNPNSLLSKSRRGEAVPAQRLWSEVQAEFSKVAKTDPAFAKYITDGKFNPIHHWNWDKETYMEWLLDPRNLFFTTDPTLHTGAGKGIHQFLQVPGKYHTRDPIPWWWILSFK